MTVHQKRQPISLIVFLALLLIVIVLTCGSSATSLTNSRIKTIADACNVLQELGWETDPLQAAETESVLPTQFDDTFISYNSIQLEQGWDLTKYAGKSVTIYTIPIINYTSSTDNVLATLIVYKGRLIGGDIHSASMNGFMHSLK